MSENGSGAGAPGAGAGAPAGAAIVGAPDTGSPTAPFTHKAKAYDPRNRPLHRVGAQVYDFDIDRDPQRRMTRIRPSGKGYDCGCRSTDDFTTSALFDSIVDGAFAALKTAVAEAVPGSAEALEALKQASGTDFEEELKRFLANTIEGAFFRSFMPFIPAWVPVNRVGFGPDFVSTNAHNVVTAQGADGQEKRQEREVEVEGFLSRSYLSRHHRPYTQWSRHYHWSFHVKPASGWQHLVGLGDIPTAGELSSLGKANVMPGHGLYSRRRADARPGSETTPSPSDLECMLDLGALSKPPSDRNPRDVFETPSILFDKRWPFWPQSGDYFWASGRLVYDCSHPSSSAKKGDEAGLHPTLINPVKAFAVARYEAFDFDGLGEFVPATRFLFFATSKGGYHDFDDKSDIKARDTDYEFIVDLPPLEEDFGEFAVGRTPDFAFNTIVVRPRLLKHIAFAPFGAGADSPLRFWQNDPVTVLVRPEKGKLPRQLRVKVPMTKMPSDRDAHGFVLTLGWHDARQVARVKKVTVQVPEFRVRDRNTQLRLHICINGRWIHFPTVNPGSGASGRRFLNVRDTKQDHPPAEGLVLHLPDDGKVTITASGTKRNRLGQFIEEKPTVDADVEKDRELAVGGIIEIRDDVAEEIREIIENELGEHIPEGVLDDADQLKELLSNENIKKLLGSAAEDLIGKRRIVVWKADVDAEPDPKKPHVTASAIAREMKVFPVLNSANEAMGMVESDLPRLREGSNVIPMRDLVARLRAGQPPLAREFQAMETVHPEETGFVFVHEQDEENHLDYILRCSVAVSEPAPAPETR